MDDIEAHERLYRGSDEETRELKELYARFDGDMDQCVRAYSSSFACDWLTRIPTTIQDLLLALLLASRHGLASIFGDAASCRQRRRVAL